ncbi:SAM-dependent methyltransferase [Winogradskyella luteola]|uniref:SAM-dependent methyltransferase n=1 Tax=Winogradskyella luteola TaxID=2828330 RepID=A0A9X1JRT1_9FLAO|nr:SAM-dependent methyltransferase [Winogradskyella luteola]MBV7270233.1 SAM-dependent methyltransferase [Winogradskyella luteola]
MNSHKGKLYLIPTRLGDNPPLEVLPISIKKIIEHVNFYIVENEKTARRFIKRVSPGKSQSKLKLSVLNKYTTEGEQNTFLNPCLEGESIGLLSEAGCPAIADPGSDIVSLAHQMNVKVVPLVGPSSILLALMASGMNGQSFTFNGYLPIDKNERKSRLKTLERLSFEQNQSQIFIETPYRNMKMLEDLAKVLHPETRVCVACDLTLPSEFIKTLPAKDWKHNKEDFHKRPAIFIIQKD